MENIMEKAVGQDGVMAKNIAAIKESFKEKAMWFITKYANDEDAKNKKVYTDEEAMKFFGTPQVCPIVGNELTNAGINNLLTLICSSSGTKWDSANAYLCVGDSSTAFNAAQTDLQAATNKLRKAMDASYPTYGTSQKATWKATFGSSEANFAWAEFAVANAASNGTILNRKVSAQGTKTAGQTWELTLEITLS